MDRMVKIEACGHKIWIELGAKGKGQITSNLKEFCKDDGFSGCCEDHEMYDCAIDGLEALVLAQACAGLDVTSKKYVAALETALESISNNL